MAVFCLATYGEGDPTDNAQAFFDWLQEGGIEFSGKKEKCYTPISIDNCEKKACYVNYVSFKAARGGTGGAFRNLFFHDHSLLLRLSKVRSMLLL